MCRGRGEGGRSDHDDCGWDMTHENDEWLFSSGHKAKRV